MLAWARVPLLEPGWTLIGAVLEVVREKFRRIH